MSELLSNIIGMIRPLDEEAMVQARARQDQLTKDYMTRELRYEVLGERLMDIRGQSFEINSSFYFAKRIYVTADFSFTFSSLFLLD